MLKNFGCSCVMSRPVILDVSFLTSKDSNENESYLALLFFNSYIYIVYE